MSKGQTLRALVNERLAAAAEDIFVLFERTITEYEEELCRSREENQRKQQLLDTVLRPRTELIRGNVQISSTSPGSGLNQEITETPRIKEEPEEPSVKQEEEQLPVPVPESSAVCVKTEESSLRRKRQKEKTQGEDISSEPHFRSETEGRTDNDDWGPLLSYSAAQMETEADGDHYNQVQIRDRSSTLSPQNQPAPETFVHREDVTRADRAKRKRHRCLICHKRFGSKHNLLSHSRVHTGEKPYSCTMCDKTFSDHTTVKRHIRTHTGEQPFGCSVCNKTFARKDNLRTHMNRARHKRLCALLAQANV